MIKRIEAAGILTKQKKADIQKQKAGLSIILCLNVRRTAVREIQVF